MIPRSKHSGDQRGWGTGKIPIIPPKHILGTDPSTGQGLDPLKPGVGGMGAIDQQPTTWAQQAADLGPKIPPQIDPRARAGRIRKARDAAKAGTGISSMGHIYAEPPIPGENEPEVPPKPEVPPEPEVTPPVPPTEPVEDVSWKLKQPIQIKYFKEGMLNPGSKMIDSDGNEDRVFLRRVRNATVVEHAKLANIERNTLLTCEHCGIQPASDTGEQEGLPVFPGMTEKHAWTMIQGHHIIPFARRKEQYTITKEELVCLCKNCHDAWHILGNEASVELDPDENTVEGSTEK